MESIKDLAYEKKLPTGLKLKFISFWDSKVILLDLLKSSLLKPS